MKISFVLLKFCQTSVKRLDCETAFQVFFKKSTSDVVFFAWYFVLILKWDRWPSQCRRKSQDQFLDTQKNTKTAMLLWFYGFIFQLQRKYNQRASNGNWIVYFLTLHSMKMLIIYLMIKLMNKTKSSSNLFICFCFHVDKIQHFTYDKWKSYLKSLKIAGIIFSCYC